MGVIILSLLSLLSPSETSAKAMLPSTLLKLDDYFSHHVIVVEKSTHKLHLYKNVAGRPELVMSMRIATGKKRGNKTFQGDHRTPEGIYQLTEFFTHQNLVEQFGPQGNIYGVGAFVLNYPNPIDSSNGKTGYGIWIHSTNDETRIELGLESRGCIVTANNKLIELSHYIELNKTSVVVVHNLNFISEEAWTIERNSIVGVLENWLDSWRNEDMDRYFSHYLPGEFRDPVRGKMPQFKRYKRAVFARPGKPTIHIDDISVMRTDQYAVVSFRQSYKSGPIDDTGRKLLYMKKDAYYNWKIASEIWTKLGIDRELTHRMAFKPSQRFFSTDDPSNILDIKYAEKKE